MTVLVTGGAGFIGAGLVRDLISTGTPVRVLDSVLFDQLHVAADLRASGAEVIEGDIRDPEARRRALEGASEVVHLAAIVGDPACAKTPEIAEDVNVKASLSLLEEAPRSGVRRLVFASTCSNYGRLPDPTVAVDEDAPLRPVSLYARQKVAVENAFVDAARGGFDTICLRFATVFGVARRMRFDLTVNEFTRDLWAGRMLQVFGADYWRPYVHVRDVSKAVQLALDASRDSPRDRVYNVGSTDENLRKRDIVELIRAQLGRGSVEYVDRQEDPRDYRVNFDRARNRLGFLKTMSVADGVREVIEALEAGRFGDPFDRCYSNV